MAIQQNPRPWIKLWTHEHIHGTTRTELLPDERSVWTDLMALAGSSPVPGFVCIADGVAYPENVLCQLLKIDKELLERSLKKMIEVNKIAQNGTGVIQVINFWKYNTKFDKKVYQREYMADKRKLDKQQSNKQQSNKKKKFVRSNKEE